MDDGLERKHVAGYLLHEWFHTGTSLREVASLIQPLNEIIHEPNGGVYYQGSQLQIHAPKVHYGVVKGGACTMQVSNRPKRVKGDLNLIILRNKAFLHA